MLKRLFVVFLTFAIVLAAGWFAMRRADIPYDRLEAVYASPDSVFLNLNDGTRVHYRDVGSRNAPTIVLVHGFSSSLHTWKDWVADLKPAYRVISIDLIGHGLSRCRPDGQIGVTQFVDTVEQVTQALGVETFTLVGNSMGGHTAWNYALEHPDRLNALVLVDASGWQDSEEERGNEPLVFKLLANKYARAVMKDLDMRSLIRSGLVDSFYDPTFVTDEMVDRYGALARAPCHRDAILNLSSSRSERRFATPELLAAIETPTLILQGENDNLVPAAHAEKFASAIPGSKLILYPEVGHLPQEEIAAQSASDLRTFLNDIAQTETVAEAPAN